MEASRRQQLLAIVAVACIGAFLADKVVVTPLTNLWKKRSQRIDELKKSLSSGLALIEREDAMKKRWGEMHEEALSQDESVAEKLVLQAVADWTRSSRIGVKSQKPRWNHDADDHTLLEFQIEAQGRLEALARFLYALESDLLALRIEDITVASRDDSGRDLTLGLHFSGLILLDSKR